ncbi:hypothetical protein, partial [Paenibacillus sp. NPDC058174]|uniref:hypothetical protein n=1 Tax=Paenibacillus sp. NPDC058174 TaxID=3346366 RepID=UPI0036D9978C
MSEMKPTSPKKTRYLAVSEAGSQINEAIFAILANLKRLNWCNEPIFANREPMFMSSEASFALAEVRPRKPLCSE